MCWIKGQFTHCSAMMVEAILLNSIKFAVTVIISAKAIHAAVYWQYITLLVDVYFSA